MLVRAWSPLLICSLFLACGAGADAGGGGGFGGDAGGGVSSGGSDGGAGGSTTTTSSSSGGLGGADGGAGGTTAGGAGGAGGAIVCDTLATCGNSGEGCVGCAITGACAAVYDACFANDQCGAYQQCASGCQGDAACLAGCEQASPNGKAPYEELFLCVICQECPVSCGADGCPP